MDLFPGRMCGVRMKFINEGGPIKIRIGTRDKCYWKTIKTNEIIELTKRIGKALGLKKLKTTTGQLGNKVVHTKQIETTSTLKEFEKEHDFFKELQSINGIGKKTAKDIVNYAKTKKILVEKIKNKDGLPFRDDVELKLRKKYG